MRISVAAALLVLCVSFPDLFAGEAASPGFDELVKEKLYDYSFRGDLRKSFSKFSRRTADRLAALAVIGAIEKLHSARSLKAVLAVVDDRSNKVLRKKAVETLGWLGYFEPGEAVEKLSAIAADPADFARFQAIAALGAMGLDGKPAAPVLLEGLKDEDLEVRWAAVKALYLFDETARVDPAHLRALAESAPSEKVNPDYEALLKRIFRNDSREISFIVSLRESKNEDLRRSVFEFAACADGLDFETLKPVISTGLREADLQLKYYAMDTLSKFESRISEFEEELVAVAESQEGYWAAARALVMLAKTGEQKHLPLLLRLLEEGEGDVKYGAIDALGSYGRAAESSAEALRKLLAGENDCERAHAGCALWKITGEAKHLEAVLEAVEIENDFLRRHACGLLREIGKPAAQAADRLLPLLREDLGLSRFYLSSALAVLAEGRKDLVPGLKKLIEEEAARGNSGFFSLAELPGILLSIAPSDETAEGLISLARRYECLAAPVASTLFRKDRLHGKTVDFLKELSVVGNSFARRSVRWELHSLSKKDEKISAQLAVDPKVAEAWKKNWEDRNAALVDRALAILGGKAVFAEEFYRIADCSPDIFGMSGSDPEKDRKHQGWIDRLRGSCDAEEMREVLKEIAGEVEDEEDAKGCLTALQFASEEDLPDLGILGFMETWKHKGEAYKSLKNALESNFAGVKDMGKFTSLRTPGLEEYLQAFMVDEDGNRLSHWSFRMRFKPLKFLEGPWPRIVVRVIEY